MSFERLSYGGGAVRSQLQSDIGSGDSSCTLTVTSGWPDGTQGPFNLTIIDGTDDTSTEEKCQATSRTGNTLVGLSRGTDGSSPVAHSAGARVLHGWTATEASEANQTGHLTLGNVTAKGDLLVGSGLNLLDGLPVSTDGLILVADSAQALGMRWGQAAAEGLEAGSVTLTQIQDAILDNSKVAVGNRFQWTAANAAGILALSAATGDLATQQDTGALLQQVGSTDTWKPPWNMPWGVQGFVTPSNFPTTSTSLVDVTSMTVTFTAVTNRLYEVTVQAGNVTSTAASDIGELAIVDTGTLVIGRALASTTSQDNVHLTWPKAYAAGSVTVKAQARRVSGTGTVTFGGLVLVVRDVGPNGNPS